MNTKKITALQERIRRIKEKILAIEQMRPGSLSKQFNVCGNPNCRCKDPDHPKKHGPYYQISYTRKGKSTTEFVRKEMLANVKKELKAYQEFKKLTDEWIDLSIEVGKLRRQEYKKIKNDLRT
jgi:hypothetical protein